MYLVEAKKLETFVKITFIPLFNMHFMYEKSEIIIKNFQTLKQIELQKE